jgi:hypothetical protein
MPEMPATAAPDHPEQDMPEADTRTHQRLAILRELAEIGMRLARGVERQAEDPEAAPGDVGLVFSRIARAVRQTLALEARFEAELQTRLLMEQGEAEDRRVREAYAPISQRSDVVRRAVGQAIEADAEDEDQEEQLFEALDERLDEHEDENDYLDRPIGELVAQICKDLGVRADLSLWEDEDWAIEEAAERAPEAVEAPESEAVPDPSASTHSPPAGAPSWLSG